MRRKVRMVGEKFGRWTVLSSANNRRTNSGRFALTYWLCRCACGVEKDVRAASLLRGKSKSCGCLRAEMYAAMTTHGMSRNGSAEYRAWQNMVNRCRNPNLPGYKHYGGRGIQVCPRWMKFENFSADMGPKPTPTHSIDRRDVNLGYNMLNCRWATATEQVNNRRKIGLIGQFTNDELLEELERRAQQNANRRQSATISK